MQGRRPPAAAPRRTPAAVGELAGGIRDGGHVPARAHILVLVACRGRGGRARGVGGGRDQTAGGSRRQTARTRRFGTPPTLRPRTQAAGALVNVPAVQAVEGGACKRARRGGRRAARVSGGARRSDRRRPRPRPRPPARTSLLPVALLPGGQGGAGRQGGQGQQAARGGGHRGRVWCGASWGGGEEEEAWAAGAGVGVGVGARGGRVRSEGERRQAAGLSGGRRAGARMGRAHRRRSWQARHQCQQTLGSRWDQLGAWGLGCAAPAVGGVRAVGGRLAASAAAARGRPPAPSTAAQLCLAVQSGRRLRGAGGTGQAPGPARGGGRRVDAEMRRAALCCPAPRLFSPLPALAPTSPTPAAAPCTAAWPPLPPAASCCSSCRCPGPRRHSKTQGCWLPRPSSPLPHIPAWRPSSGRRSARGRGRWEARRWCWRWRSWLRRCRAPAPSRACPPSRPAWSPSSGARLMVRGAVGQAGAAGGGRRQTAVRRRRLTA